MSRDSMEPPVFGLKTRCCSAGLLLLEIVSALALLVLYFLAPVRRGTLLQSWVLSLASTTCGILGVCRSTPAVVGSLMVAIGMCFGSAVLAGLCGLFALDVELAIAALLDQSIAPLPQEPYDSMKEELVLRSRITLLCAATILAANVLAHLCFGYHLHHLVGAKRGSVALLQIFSVITFLVSLFLILGGQYVVDTGILVSAPYAGLAIFSSGVMMLTVALLAFIGANFEYRRLLSICYLFSIFVGLLFVVMAIACFAVRGAVQEGILESWESIRIVLPPTTQVAYSRDRFAALMQAYLNVVAYVGLISGLFILAAANSCLTLMCHVTTWKHNLTRAKKNIKRSQQTGGGLAMGPAPSNSPRPESSMSLHEKVGGRRNTLRVMCTSVVFTAKCSSIGSLVASSKFSLVSPADQADVDVIRVSSSFSRGTVAISASSESEGNVAFEVYGTGDRVDYVQELFESKVGNGVLDISMEPRTTTRFLWLEGSCQSSKLELAVPQNQSRALVVNSNTSVEVNYADVDADTMELRGLSVTTEKAAIACLNVDIGEAGLLLQSTAGEISAEDVSVDASESLAPETCAKVHSPLGRVVLKDVALLECDLEVEASVGDLEMSTIRSAVVTGRSRIQAKSLSASISAHKLQANWIDLSSESGNVIGTYLDTEGNSAFMGRLEITTVSGDVSLKQLAASGDVHVETASGSISVQLKTQSFTGMYYMRSEYGSMSIRKGNYSTDVVTEAEDSSESKEKYGSINCDTETGTCLSFGDLHLRSTLGDIEIVLGCDSFSCS